MEAKIYSAVHVIVVKWEQSGFENEIELEYRIHEMMKVCHEYRWEPKLYRIQGWSSSECTQLLLNAVKRWSGDSSHLLIIAYSGHGSLDYHGNLLLSGNGHTTINWNTVQGLVQDTSKADVLFFLDTCHAAAALRQYRHIAPLTDQEPQKRQELIAACGREQTSPQGGPGVLSTIWFSLLRNYIHSTIPETTDSLHTKANESKDVQQSFFRANLLMYTPAIPLQPCYKALYRWGEELVDDDPSARHPGKFRIVVVPFNVGSPTPPLPKDTYQKWCGGRTMVHTVKKDFEADFAKKFAKKFGVSIKALSLRVGPVEPHDAKTLFGIKQMMPGHYTHTDAQLIVFEAWFTLTKRGGGYPRKA